MSAPENLFCSMLKAQYDALLASIELLIQAPASALQMLLSNIKRIFDVMYASIIAALEVLAAQLDTLLGLGDIDQNETKLAFCRIAYACEPLQDILFSTSKPLLPFLTAQQIDDAKNNYEKFEEFVCKVGLKGLLDQWTNVAIDEIGEQLDALQNRLLGALGIEELIENYMRAVADSGIYDVLDSLKKYGNCAFEVCNYANTSDNTIEEVENKLGIVQAGTGYVFLVTDNIQKVLETDDNISVSIAKMRARIDKWKNEGIRDTKDGVPLDQIVSF